MNNHGNRVYISGWLISWLNSNEFDRALMSLLDQPWAGFGSNELAWLVDWAPMSLIDLQWAWFGSNWLGWLSSTELAWSPMS